MNYYSTRNTSHVVSYKQAIRRGSIGDGGLYFPETIPSFPIEKLSGMTDVEIAYHVLSPFIEEDIDNSRSLIEDMMSALKFPLHSLGQNQHVLELFHGPTLAFKDVGARFLARCLSSVRKADEDTLTVLVATSGDTGGAVAHAFSGVEGIRVVLLYPKGRVSRFQEKQLTTAGGETYALEVDGSFDDCQRMVKSSFADQELSKKYHLISANSINIGRLLAQAVYYFVAYRDLSTNEKVNYVVPSGNFGNLTAGLIAKRMGLPIGTMIAATNANDTIPRYLQTGMYEPQPSVQTISNAMDVGNPNNYERIRHMYGNSVDRCKKEVVGYAYDDKSTEQEISAMYRDKGYLLDPHTAVGMLASRAYREQTSDNSSHHVVLGTAHPIKFYDVIEPVIKEKVPIPDQLKQMLDKPKKAYLIGNNDRDLSNFIGDLPQ